MHVNFIYFKMDESNEENIFQNVTKPETEDKIEVTIAEVTEEQLDFEKKVVENIGENQGEFKEEDSQRTETEPYTQPMVNSAEDEDKREGVSFNRPISYLLIIPIYRVTLGERMLQCQILKLNLMSVQIWSQKSNKRQIWIRILVKTLGTFKRNPRKKSLRGQRRSQPLNP